MKSPNIFCGCPFFLQQAPKGSHSNLPWFQDWEKKQPIFLFLEEANQDKHHVSGSVSYLWGHGAYGHLFELLAHPLCVGWLNWLKCLVMYPSSHKNGMSIRNWLIRYFGPDGLNIV
jgi:hypothetical protein